MSKWFLLIALAASHAVAAGDWLVATSRLEQAWTRATTVFYSPKTHLLYDCLPARVEPAGSFTNGLLNPEKSKHGYGRGMGDCDIICGVALSMLVDRYEITQDPALAVWARNLFLGLKGCATVHGIPGFIARGVCVEDGKSICITSSRDQVTHFVHGLWRYYHSPMCDDDARADIRALFAALADKMLRDITPANNYSFPRADGTVEPRGVHKMWEVYPHEAARLPMIYAAAWDVTREGKYFEAYRHYIKPAIEQSLELGTAKESYIRARMPTYTLLQMQSSLELLYALETDSDLKNAICNAMRIVAKMGAERAISVNGGEAYICVCGEAALAQLMAVDYTMDDRQVGLLRLSLLRTDPAKAGVARAVHLAAAYWRYRRLLQGARPF